MVSYKGTDEVDDLSTALDMWTGAIPCNRIIVLITTASASAGAIHNSNLRRIIFTRVPDRGLPGEFR